MLLSGGGSNLRALIDAAAEPGFPARIVAVGADGDAGGIAHALAAGIPHFIVRPRDYANRDAWGDAFLAEIQAASPDLVVSAGLMRILPEGFVRALSPHLINTHPALLPLHPGAHAVRDALAAGATETGLTVHVIDEGVDTGPIIRQASIAILPGEVEADLHERIKQVERPLLIEVVRDIADGTISLTEIARGADQSTP